MRKSTVFGFLVIPILMSVGLEAGTVYRWVDENGKVHYSDRPREGGDAETVELDEPQSVSDSEEDRQRKAANAQWFEQRRQEREREEEAESKARAKAYKANEKYRRACRNAQDRLANTEKELQARKRAGIKPRVENHMKIRIERYRDEVRQRC